MQLLFKLCISEETKIAEYLSIMERTKVELTRRVTRRQSVAQGDTFADQRLVLAETCLQLAKLHQKLYSQAGCERIVPPKDRPRSKNEDRSKGDVDSNGVAVGTALQHIDVAVVLCQEAIDHVATVVGKSDPHRPYSKTGTATGGTGRRRSNPS
ncbi:unnamed protein product [Dicrocoelium dendriticum]|nr:unnamed protein product [Dicrocoelium dendriticum]